MLVYTRTHVLLKGYSDVLRIGALLVNLLTLWPFFLLSCIYVMSYFNPDYFIAPALIIKYPMLSKPILVLIVGSIGFIEMLGGYIGWSGVRGIVERLIKDDLNFLKKVKRELETEGYMDWLRIYFSRKYLNFLNESDSDGGIKKNLLNMIMDWFLRHITKIVKGGGYFGIFMLGIIPIPGFRVVPDVFCGTTRWKKGFAVLALANFLKTAAFIYGWSWFLS